MSTWYAQYSTNWTNTDPTSGGDPSVTSIWNSQADGSGSWGTPVDNDTANTNNNAVTWDYVLDGANFGLAITIAGSGSLTFATILSQVVLNHTPVTVNGNLTLATTGVGIQIPNLTTLTITNCTLTGATISLVSGGILAISALTDGGSNAIAVGSASCVTAAAPVAGITVSAGGALAVTAGAWNGVGITNNGTAWIYYSVTSYPSSGPVFTGNAPVVVPPQADVTNATSYGILPSALDGTITAARIVGISSLPATSNVKSGITYGPSASLTGTIVLPSINDVRNGTTFGASSGLTGNVVLPATSNVKTGISYDSLSSLTGTIVLPATTDVKSGVTFGASSSLTGSYTGSGGSGGSMRSRGRL